MTPLSETEIHLMQYYYAAKELQRLKCELKYYEDDRGDYYNTIRGHDFNAIRSKNKMIIKPVENAVELIDKINKIQIGEIERQITHQQIILDGITSLLNASGLDGAERTYITYRYLHKLELKAVQAKMNITEYEGKKLRTGALEKIEKVRK